MELAKEREDWRAVAAGWLREHQVSGPMAMLVAGPSRRHPEANHRIEFMRMSGRPQQVPSQFRLQRSTSKVAASKPGGRTSGTDVCVDNACHGADNSDMNVKLPTPLEEFVQRKVATGEFHSVDEVVCKGLFLLQHQDAWNAEARRKIDVGWEQAKCGQLLAPERAEARLAVQKEA